MPSWSRLFFLIGVLLLIAHSQEEDAPVDLGDEPLEEEASADGEEENPSDEGSEEEEEGESVWQDEAMSEEQMLKMHGKIDANKDGKVTMDEISTFRTEMREATIKKDVEAIFESIDTNNDGKISLQEMIEHAFGSTPVNEEGQPEDLPPHPSDDPLLAEREKQDKELEGEKFKVADANKDGFLNKEELADAFYPEHHEGVLQLTASASLKARDKDGDGELTNEEFWDNAADEELSEDTIEAQKNDFDAVDTDKSGKLNLEEFKKWESGAFHFSDAMKQLFEVADTDEDKHLTAEEMESAREALGNSLASTHFTEWIEHHEL